METLELNTSLTLYFYCTLYFYSTLKHMTHQEQKLNKTIGSLAFRLSLLNMQQNKLDLNRIIGKIYIKTYSKYLQLNKTFIISVRYLLLPSFCRLRLIYKWFRENFKKTEEKKSQSQWNRQHSLPISYVLLTPERVLDCKLCIFLCFLNFILYFTVFGKWGVGGGGK